MKYFNAFLEKKIQPILKILNDITQTGGTSYLVGGSVRDLLLAEQENLTQASDDFDVDIEIHRLDLDELEKVLAEFGQVILVGKQFGVLRVKGLDVDWSVPRSDSIGRKPKVETDKNMGIEAALLRRDVTINAMALDLNDLAINFKQVMQQSHNQLVSQLCKIVDPFDGQEHLKNKQIHPVCAEKFVQDPLRFYRVMQLISRFQLTPTQQMNALATSMDLSTDIATERITQELKKMLLAIHQPSLGLQWLESINRFSELFPDLMHDQLFKQLDFTAEKSANLPEADKLALRLTTLTIHMNTAQLKAFFKLYNFGHALCRQIAKFNRLQSSFEKSLSDYKLKKLAADLSPEWSLEKALLAAVCVSKIAQKAADTIHAQATTLNVVHQPEPPLLTGADLLEKFGQTPELGKALAKAYDLQLKHELTTKHEIIQVLLER